MHNYAYIIGNSSNISNKSIRKFDRDERSPRDTRRDVRSERVKAIEEARRIDDGDQRRRRGSGRRTYMRKEKKELDS